jgi:8-oxo-dGTP diphosphatase
MMERLNDPTRPTAFELVPPRFTLTELQGVYEAVWGRRVDKRNFRARLLARGLVEPVARARRIGRHRPAQLYRWKHRA